MTRRSAPRTRWTADEEQTVRRHYATAEWPSLLAALPGRTRTEIACKARAMGVARREATVPSELMPRGEVARRWFEISGERLTRTIVGHIERQALRKLRVALKGVA